MNTFISSTWNIIDQCNLCCGHCFADANADRPRPRQYRNRTFVIDDLAKLGVRDIVFSGGEPLLSADLFDLIAAARTRHMRVRLATNGLLLTASVAQRLKASGVASVQVSVDGPENVHDCLRGHPGAYLGAVQALSTLAHAGLHSSVATVLMKRNCTLGVIRHITTLIAEQQVQAWGIERFVPVGRGRQSKQELVDCAEYMEVLRRASSLVHATLPRVQLAIQDPLRVLVSAPEEAAEAFAASTAHSVCLGCAAMIMGFSISANGDIYPCPRLPLSVGNVFDGGLAHLDEQPLCKQLQKREAIEGCGGCEYLRVCGGCRAYAFAVAGNPLGRDGLCPRAQ
ncbi:MAG: radical SAM protein [Polyangia bacterium]